MMARKHSVRVAMSVAENLLAVQLRIRQACIAAGREPSTVRLLAVSKTVDADRLRTAAQAGQHAFGENYLQEALPKQRALAGVALEWHHIGLIQSNKTAEIAAHFDWAQGVDRLKIAQRLSGQRPATLPPLQVCLQVNVSGEASKSGCGLDEALPLAQAIAQLPRLELRGLMCLPAPTAAQTDPRAPFRLLRELLETMNRQGLSLDTLSMGMSDDFEHAIAEGATLLRIGSAIFGSRAGKTRPESAS